LEHTSPKYLYLVTIQGCAYREGGSELKRMAEILPPKFYKMAKMKFDLNKGLSKFSQGRKKSVKAIRVSYKACLGFKPLIKHQFKKNKKKKACHKVTHHFVPTIGIPKICTTLPTEPPA